jgi:hypothetical protein
VGKAKDIASIKEHPSLCWNAGCGDNSEFSEITLDGYSLHCVVMFGGNSTYMQKEVQMNIKIIDPPYFRKKTNKGYLHFQF